jgi:hypothetical protein
MSEMKIVLTTLRCKRCGYKWIPRSTKPPIRCAQCRSPYWRLKARKYVRNVVPKNLAVNSGSRKANAMDFDQDARSVSEKIIGSGIGPIRNQPERE